MPKRLSLQLYSARNAGSIDAVLSIAARSGYREVEGYGGVYGKPDQLARKLSRAGLSMPSGHFALDMLDNETTAAVATARALGIVQVYAPWLDEAQRPKTSGGWRKLGKRLAVIGERLRGEGLSFGWHNHDFEFVRLPGGEYPIDLIFDAAPFIDWECDVAWVARAKANPMFWIRRHGARITAVHVKDIAPKGQAIKEGGWADVGEGVLDWPKLIAAVRSQTRANRFVMEHDNPADFVRFAERSYRFVSKI
jgi:sugar phosphate isomerase/epimerase